MAHVPIRRVTRMRRANLSSAGSETMRVSLLRAYPAVLGLGQHGVPVHHAIILGLGEVPADSLATRHDGAPPLIWLKWP